MTYFCTLIWSHLFSLSFFLWCGCLIWKHHWQDQCQKDIYIFFSRRCTVLVFTFSYLIHFELIFLEAVRQGSSFINSTLSTMDKSSRQKINYLNSNIEFELHFRPNTTNSYIQNNLSNSNRIYILLKFIWNTFLR